MQIWNHTYSSKSFAAGLAGLAGLFALAGPASAAPVQWTDPGANGHYYEYFQAAATFSAASALAASSTHLGLQGYLVTITSAAENAFVLSLTQGQYFIGASDTANPGTFVWLGGPEQGQAFWQRGVGNVGAAINGAYAGWNPGEPNDGGAFAQGAEPLIVGRFGAGGWNDVPLGYTAGFVIEYGPSAATVIPVPAALPLLASGLALLGFGLRRRKA